MSLKGVAKETLKILEDRSFTNSAGSLVDFSDEQAAAEAGTRLYRPHELSALNAPGGEGFPSVEVTPETTQIAAQRLVEQEGHADLVLLNFASARNPGGGFVNGAKAQEEDLSRCSGLYPCLLTQPAYYEANRCQSSLLYTDHMIYSPAVPWFRTRSRNMLDQVFLASVITAPAPNAGQALRRSLRTWPKIEEALRRRAGYVLAVARDNGHRILLLGAWGCGVFRNQPEMVADAFGRHLDSHAFGGCFDRVVFAIYDTSKSKETLHAFQKRFG